MERVTASTLGCEATGEFVSEHFLTSSWPLGERWVFWGSLCLWILLFVPTLWTPGDKWDPFLYQSLSLFFLWTISVIAMRFELDSNLKSLCRLCEWFLTPQGDVISAQFSCWPGQECCAHEISSMPIFWFSLECKCALFLSATPAQPTQLCLT